MIGTVQIPSDDPTAILNAVFNNAGYHNYLKACEEERDSFWMYVFKVKKCPRCRAHDWTDCPYAHTGEKARRRDPRRVHYGGLPCLDFRKGGCKKGDSCEFAHGVFECWLHPSRYRTQPCKDGLDCPRRVCFFAHKRDQLRTMPTYQNSYSINIPQNFVSSPTSILASPPFSSPSQSPPNSPQVGEFMELVASMRQMSMNGGSSTHVGSGFRPWGLGAVSEEEPVMERVESGRDLRARMYAKLSKENSFDRFNECPS